MNIALSSDSLVKTYGSGSRAVHALQSLTLDIRQGEIFSLLGPNGAGKTTFIKCLLGIIRVTSGSATVLGHPHASLAAKEMIGYLPENHRYPSYLTGFQVLDYLGRLSGLRGDGLRVRIGESLEIVGMADWAKTRVSKYSKGMMQRLGLAQAMLNDPALLILDEPTDGVDPVGRKEIREVLLRLRAEGKTVLMNSHLLSEVERISDRVAIMDHGKLLRSGTIAELTASEGVYELRVENANALSDIVNLTKGATAGLYHITALDLEQLNAILDQVRARGALISALTPVKGSLEDYFVQLLQDHKLDHQ